MFDVHGRGLPSIEVEERVGIEDQQAVLRPAPPARRGRRGPVSLRMKSTSRRTSSASGSRAVVSRTARRTCAARSPGASRRSRSARCGGLLVGERAVEQAERLGGHGGRVADGATGVGVGRVVRRQDRDQERPLDVDVDAPPGGLVRWRGLPSLARHRLAGQDFARDRRIDARPAGLEFAASPLTARIESRTSSAVSRRIGNRQNHRFAGSRPARRATRATTSGRRSRARSGGASA